MEQTREYMLEIIQKEISDKTLSKGCEVYVDDGYGGYDATIVGYNDTVLYVLDEDCIHINNDLSTLKIKGDIKVIGHPVMIGDVLDRIETNKSEIENRLNKCPRCGGSIDFQEGQQSFPETGQRDFKSSFYCNDDYDKDCQRDSTQKEDFSPNEICYIIDAISNGVYEWDDRGLRKKKRKPLSEQSDECIRYIYSLLPSEVRK